MEYKILVDGEVIAEFKCKHDRDNCFNLLQELHDDCIWTKS